LLDFVRNSESATSSHQKNVLGLFQLQGQNRVDSSFDSLETAIWVVCALC
jgi:hypothetical protein